MQLLPERNINMKKFIIFAFIAMISGCFSPTPHFYQTVSKGNFLEFLHPLEKPTHIKYISQKFQIEYRKQSGVLILSQNKQYEKHSKG